MKKGFLFFFIASGIFLCDQLTKYLIMHTITMSASVPIIRNVVYLSYIHNTGAAFGMLQGQTLSLIWLSVAVLGAIFFFYDSLQTTPELVCVALILGGTLGNLIDRLRLGYVVDYIDFRIWPAFNVADSALCVGVIGLVVFWFFEERKKPKKKIKPIK